MKLLWKFTVSHILTTIVLLGIYPPTRTEYNEETPNDSITMRPGISKRLTYGKDFHGFKGFDDFVKHDPITAHMAYAKYQRLTGFDNIDPYNIYNVYGGNNAYKGYNSFNQKWHRGKRLENNYNTFPDLEVRNLEIAKMSDKFYNLNDQPKLTDINQKHYSTSPTPKVITTPKTTRKPFHFQDILQDISKLGQMTKSELLHLQKEYLEYEKTQKKAKPKLSVDNFTF